MRLFWRILVWRILVWRILGVFVLVGVLAVPAEAEEITVLNQSAHAAKVAAPGARSVRVAVDGEPVVLRLDRDAGDVGQGEALQGREAQGVEAKVWWTANPRELCIIFVRYGGVLRITGKSSIRCLGN